MLSRNAVKYIQSLTHKKFRDIHQCFIAETPKVVHEFVVAGYNFEMIYGTATWTEEFGRMTSYEHLPVTMVAEDDLKRISQLKTPHQVVAVIKIRENIASILLKNKITLALDGLQDPGNVGTIIRIADWFGIETILCNTHTANAYNPKVVQASMGSLAHIGMHYLDLVPFLSEVNVTVFAASLEGKSIYNIGKINEGILVIGNEGNGISDAVLSVVSEHLTIPRIGKAESLNAAMATGIILSKMIGG